MSLGKAERGSTSHHQTPLVKISCPHISEINFKTKYFFSSCNVDKGNKETGYNWSLKSGSRQGRWLEMMDGNHWFNTRCTEPEGNLGGCFVCNL